ncbi:MAG: hypothetical protein GEU95_26885 [Rhizobiales bacterium]|nr:hypothetical protein [Hyphomicrobiales bacterium]
MNVRKVLTEVLRAERGKPFVWGESDCLMTAAAFAQAVTGDDPVAHLRGRYDSEFSWKRVMVEEGWRDMGDVAASIFREVPVAMSRAGDWARVTNEDGSDGLGVVVGDLIAVRSLVGLGYVPLLRARRAFRVG